MRYCLLVACLLQVPLFADAATHTLDYRRVTVPMVRSAARAAAVALGEGVVREKRLPAAETPCIKGALSVGDRLQFWLFDDRQIEVELVERLPSALAGESFAARITGEEGLRSAVVVRTGDGLQANIQSLADNRVFTVSAGANGTVVRELDPGAGVRIPSPPRIPLRKGDVKPRPVKSAQAVSDDKVEVDVLVACETGAKTWLDGEYGGISNFAQTAVSKMNVALANTGLDASFRFRLVGVVAVPEKQTDMDAALDAATNGTGVWKCVVDARDEFGADIVTVLIDTGSAYGQTGLGWSLKEGDYGDYSWFSESAYNVCSVRAVVQNHTMTHEIGHNMGAGHSEKQDPQPGPQLFPYSCGYYFTAGGKPYHTIMAYDTDGSSDTYYIEIPYFSSPDYTYGGVPVGTADRNDNTRTLRATFAQVAAFRAQKGGGGGGEGDSGLTWLRSRTAAIDEAKKSGKLIFMISGRETCGNTVGTRDYSCEDPSVKGKLMSGYVVWFNDCDNEGAESWRYASGLGSYTLPLVCVIDPSNPDSYIARLTGYLSPSALLEFLDGAGTSGGDDDPEPFTDMTPRTETANGYTWKYRIVDGGAELFSEQWYQTDITPAPRGRVVIPDRLGGCPVTSIGQCAFSDEEHVSGMTDVVIPETVKAIGFFAFSDNVKLESVALPDALESIGEGAFGNCAKLTALTVPAKVEEISDEHGSCFAAFTGCKAMKGFYVAPDNLCYESVDGVIYTRGKAALVACPAQKASVDIPSTVTHIYGCAFKDCTALSALRLPPNLVSVGRYAFYGCGIRSITIPGSMKRIKDEWFSGPFSEVVISSGTEVIGTDAFSDCWKMTDLTIPCSVISIKKDAFSFCGALKTVHVDQGDAERVKAMLAASEFDVSGIRFIESEIAPTPVPRYTISYVLDGGVNVGGNPLSYSAPELPLVLAEPIRDGYEFAGWTLDGAVVTEIALGRVGDLILVATWKSGSAPVPSPITDMTPRTETANGYTWKYRIIDGGAELFSEQWYQTDITPAPSGRVVIPARLGGYPVTGIGQCAFANGDDSGYVRQVVVPHTVRNIGFYAFYENEEMTNLILPDALEVIGTGAFEGCSSLKSLDIPANVRDISDENGYCCSIVSGCQALERLSVSPDNPYFTSIDGVIYSKDLTTLVACSARLAAVTIPDSVTYIYGAAFDNCVCLKELRLPPCLESAGRYAFSGIGCERIVVPGSLTQLPYGAFMGSAIREAVILSGVEVIPGDAFSCCLELEKVTIPSSVFEISPDAFYHSSRLSTVLVDAGDVSRIKSMLSDSGFNVSGVRFQELDPDACLVFVDWDSSRGRVTGAGSYKRGNTATLKATANAGFAFGGWYDAELRLLSQSASWNLLVEKDVENIRAAFIPAADDWAKVTCATTTIDYVTNEAIKPIKVKPDCGSMPTVKVTGLPTGLKYTDKDVLDSKKVLVAAANTIYGTPTKSGIYVAMVTVTTAGRKTATEELKFIVRKPDEKIVDIEYNSLQGKATGAGIYKTGKSAALKATANKGYLFNGWYDGETLLSQASSYAYPMGAEDKTLRAKFIASTSDWATVSCATTKVEYVTGAAFEPIAVKPDCGSMPTVKVTGLPTGLKFAAKDVVDSKTKAVTVPANTIYGTPTKSGVYTVVATVTTAGKRTASASQTVVVRKPGEFVVKAEVPPVGDAAPGKVTGMGVYAKDKKVTLKAAANKGYVFSGWYDGDVFLSRAASYVIDKMPEEDVGLTAEFVTKAEDEASIAASVDGIALEPWVSKDVTQARATNVTAGVYLAWPVSASALSATTAKVSGLPSGLKFTAKNIYKKGSKTEVDVPANTIYGAPTAASKVGKPSTIKVTVTTAGKSKADYVISLTVDPIPGFAVGTFDGWYGDGEDVLGSATLTLAANGKVSGKVLMPVDKKGKTYNFKADSLSGFSRADDGSVTNVTVAATLTGENKAAVPLALTFAPDEIGIGCVEGAFDSPWSGGVWLAQNGWKRGGYVFPNIPKNIVKTLDDGLTLTFKKNGVVTIGGKIVGDDGVKPVTAKGSSQLFSDPASADGFLLFVYVPPAKNLVSGLCRLYDVELVDAAVDNVVTDVKLTER